MIRNELLVRRVSASKQLEDIQKQEIEFSLSDNPLWDKLLTNYSQFTAKKEIGVGEVGCRGKREFHFCFFNVIRTVSLTNFLPLNFLVVFLAKAKVLSQLASKNMSTKFVFRVMALKAFSFFNFYHQTQWLFEKVNKRNSSLIQRNLYFWVKIKILKMHPVSKRFVSLSIVSFFQYYDILVTSLGK